MECKNCGSPMYERKTTRSEQAAKVYVCSECATTLYVWSDEEDKWELDKK